MMLILQLPIVENERNTVFLELWDFVLLKSVRFTRNRHNCLLLGAGMAKW